MISEFREFAMRGNVLDLAVGVVLGAAFGKIVSGPGGRPDHAGDRQAGRRRRLQRAGTRAGAGAHGRRRQGDRRGAAALRHFLQTILDFVLVAFAVFAFVKVINKLYRKQEAAPVAAAPAEDIVLLTEIRDSLRAPR
jgi:large conductance mechanosensitive channel